ncbi:hypothetical protein HDZ31DRAFT_43068 [Schizophyllum fasciatum]
MQHFGKGALRVAKNYTKGYSDVQAKVREATSNDPDVSWGPSGTQMNELAQMTYNQQDFVEIMEMLDKRLNDKGKNWRHVFKSLTVIDYCLHQGSENVVIYFKDNMYVIKTLKEFQYIDEEGKDQGANVRQKAKDITNLLSDEARLREERRARASMRDRMLRMPGADDADDEGLDENDGRRDERRPRREDDELRSAIEASKRSLAQDRVKAEERELQEAIRLSKEEEAKRARAVDDSNARALFDDMQEQPQNNNPFPNMLDPAPYATGLQPQFTAAPQFVQPQFTSFNPYQQQMEMQQQQLMMQQQQQQQQEEWMRQQQQEDWMRQQQALQQQQQQQEEWMRQQMMLQQQQQQQQQQPFLMAQPTGMGSNNPFAPSPAAQSPAPSSTLSPPSFNLPGTYDSNGQAPQYGSSPSPSQFGGTNPSPSPQPAIKVKARENENERLANLFANRDDGQDTFGNIGSLRCVRDSVGLYGNAAGRNLVAQQTGVSHNPFAMQQQQQQQQAEQPFFSV